jgi:hypothetical protein
MFADDEHSRGVNLAFHASVELDGAFKIDNAFERDVFAQDGKVLGVGLLILRLLGVPHEDAPCCSRMMVREGRRVMLSEQQQLCLSMIRKIFSNISYLTR